MNLRLSAALLVVPTLGLAAPSHIRTPISIPMRDGQSLAADLYTPSASGEWPAVLVQTPYNKNLFVPIFAGLAPSDPLLNSPDYAFVVLDWRGFFASAGAAYQGAPTKGQDGHDAVEWIAAQPWCTGDVGTWGASALGLVQFQTAAEQPPHLRACVPIVAQWRSRYEGYYPGGVYQWNKNSFVDLYFGGGDFYKAHPTRDTFWTVLEAISGDVSRIDVPMLHVSGWYDHNTEISLREARDIQSGGGPGAQGRQWVIIGPWSHSHVGQLTQGTLEFPAAVDADTAEAKAFFDVFLRGIGAFERPMFRTFRVNDDTWIESDTWPPPDAETQTLFLHADGSLGAAAPMASGASLECVADPSNPVPTLFGAILTETSATQGPGDLSPIESQPDVLTFTTPVLAEPMTLAGTPAAHLWITCDAVDTDLAVRLTQVTPQGESLLLVDMIRRASLRGDFATRQLLSPDTPYEIPVALPSIGATIPAGHRLRVSVAPSNWDRFDVNQQDGSSLSDDEGATPTPAQVHLLLDPSHPSRVELPVVPGADSTGLALR